MRIQVEMVDGNLRLDETAAAGELLKDSDIDAMIKYLKLFNHLWKIKRVESTLSAGWMRIAGGARTFLRVPGITFSSGYTLP